MPATIAWVVGILLGILWVSIGCVPALVATLTTLGVVLFRHELQALLSAVVYAWIVRRMRRAPGVAAKPKPV